MNMDKNILSSNPISFLVSLFIIYYLENKYFLKIKNLRQFPHSSTKMQVLQLSQAHYAILQLGISFLTVFKGQAHYAGQRNTKLGQCHI